VSIVEHRDVDLAVVKLPPMESRLVHRFTQRRLASLHPMAVHNRTPMMRVAYMQGRHYWIELRYETAVQFVSRPLRPRPDLGIFAERMNHTESSGGQWQFEGVGGLTPKLHLRDSHDSSIEPEAFLAELILFLRDAPPAWDPWSVDGFR
jgi:hypothetical protein